MLDAHRVIAFERIVPRDRGDGLLEVGGPALAGDRVVWPVARSERTGSEMDLAIRPFSERRADGPARPDGEEPFARVEVTGRPRDLVADGRLLAWRVLVDGRLEVAWCLLSEAPGAPETRAPSCPEQRLEPGPGLLSPPRVGRGWLLWQRDDGTSRSIEGCPVSATRDGRGRCTPRPLVALDDGPRWALRSFDGQRMLLQAGTQLAFCAPRRDGAPCAPEPLAWASSPLAPSDAAHDGSLIALRETGVASRPPLGCLPGDVDPECRERFAVVERLLACRVDPVVRVCEPAPITDLVRIERFAGLSVSAGRVAWSLAEPLEEPALHVCAFDADTGTCPVQRVTGAPASQDLPSIDGTRLIWRGGRLAGPSIWAYALPELALPASRRVRAGQTISLPGRAATGDARRLRYEVELVRGGDGDVDAGMAEAPGASAWSRRGHRARRPGPGGGPDPMPFRIEDPGRAGGRIRLVGRVPRGSAGETLELRVRATTEAGLWSEQRLRLDVAPLPRARARPPRWGAPNDAGRTRRSGWLWLW